MLKTSGFLVVTDTHGVPLDSLQTYTYGNTAHARRYRSGIMVTYGHWLDYFTLENNRIVKAPSMDIADDVSNACIRGDTIVLATTRSVSKYIVRNREIVNVESNPHPWYDVATYYYDGMQLLCGNSWLFRWFTLKDGRFVLRYETSDPSFPPHSATYIRGNGCDYFALSSEREGLMIIEHQNGVYTTYREPYTTTANSGYALWDSNRLLLDLGQFRLLDYGIYILTPKMCPGLSSVQSTPLPDQIVLCRTGDGYSISSRGHVPMQSLVVVNVLGKIVWEEGYSAGGSYRFHLPIPGIYYAIVRSAEGLHTVLIAFVK
jgi:hypothetical protein